MKRDTILAWVRINGLVITAIAVASLVGHLSRQPRMYNWNASQSGMGLNTALEFLCTGLSLYLMTLLNEGDG